jgi:hypothetical protein
LRGDDLQDFEIVANDCSAGRVVPAGGSCSVDLAFRPAAGTGSRTAAVTVTHDWVGGEIAVALMGTAAAAPAAPGEARGSSVGGGGAGSPALLGLLMTAAVAFRRKVGVGVAAPRAFTSTAGRARPQCEQA